MPIFLCTMFLSFYVSIVFVFSVIAAIAKQSQFHPGGSGYPVTSNPPLYKSNAPGRKSFYNYTEQPPFLFT